LVMRLASWGLVTAASARQDVLLLVDDLPWVDRQSQAVLAFLTRRLSGPRVTVVAATRPGQEGALAGRGVILELAPLPPEDAEQLLSRQHPTLAARSRDFVLDQARGNPLALVELPRSLPRG